MHRGPIGTYDVTSYGSESVRAFVPAPLPPQPPLVLSGTLQQLLESASLALGRLDGVTSVLPDEKILLYSYVRKEAVLSSQIEGTQSSFSNLLLFELDEAPGVPLDDVSEVSNHVAALQYGLGRLRGNFPLCNRLLREIHQHLLSGGRVHERMPGEFRHSQNWIGGTRPGDAVFVPPPHTAVPNCMAALEQFLHSDDGIPVLLRAGLAHVQFETIHPFLDGNGRLGRLLMTLLLCQSGLLREPLLYPSLYFKQHRGDYYDLLNLVRETGDWEAWLRFFLEGVQQTAEGAFSTARRLTRMFEEHRDHLQANCVRQRGSVLQVHEALKRRVLLSLPATRTETNLTFATVAAAMDVLVRHGIAREITGRRRNRVFLYEEYLSILNEGIDVP